MRNLVGCTLFFLTVNAVHETVPLLDGSAKESKIVVDLELR